MELKVRFLKVCIVLSARAEFLSELTYVSRTTRIFVPYANLNVAGACYHGALSLLCV